MARNKITDLNDHLFAQLERLNDEEIEDKKMELEFEKAKAISSIASQIIKASKLQLDAIKLMSVNGIKHSEIPDSFSVKQLGSAQSSH